MSRMPIRRSQLIAPFGTGALMTSPDGVSLICAGLDHWYKHEDLPDTPIDVQEYKIREWRLEKILDVSHFRIPPDYRWKNIGSNEHMNKHLTIPALRFPQWHYCRFCGFMRKYSLTTRGKLDDCPKCSEKGKKGYMIQVPIIAMCSHGHIQDFPWREWVHSSSNPTCNSPMRLVSSGGLTLSSMYVMCECGKKRYLVDITKSNPDGRTFLSQNLDPKKEFLCQGKRPWLGTEEGEKCSKHLVGALRNALNVYFASVKSALYIPLEEDREVDELVSILQQGNYAQILELSRFHGIEGQIRQLRQFFPVELGLYSDEKIKHALEIIYNPQDLEFQVLDEEAGRNVFGGRLRIEEYRVLSRATDKEDLIVRPVDMSLYKTNIQTYFSEIFLVDKLKETRAFAGFKRINVDEEEDLYRAKSMLRLKQPQNDDENWLPAYVVYGEGIFFKLNPDRLHEWESEEVKSRIQPLSKRFYLRQDESRAEITPRFILVHTLAHLLINQLTFECGYSTSALRERLYVSDDEKHEMCGILIYTAAGDSDGTLGGLVRMGKPGYMEQVLSKAIHHARWCSADPICMEMGAQGGQGPGSCNLAACHNCALVPETACEQFNRFLDRGLVIDERIGFFRDFQD